MNPRIPQPDLEGTVYYDSGRAWILKRLVRRLDRRTYLKESRWVRAPDLDARKNQE